MLLSTELPNSLRAGFPANRRVDCRSFLLQETKSVVPLDSIRKKCCLFPIFLVFLFFYTKRRKCYASYPGSCRARAAAARTFWAGKRKPAGGCIRQNGAHAASFSGGCSHRKGFLREPTCFFRMASCCTPTPICAARFICTGSRAVRFLLPFRSVHRIGNPWCLPR